jgi:hypothetical protein
VVSQLNNTPLWAGYALAATNFNLEENENILKLIVQRKA